MDRVLLLGFTSIFAAVVIFIAMNTIFGGIIFPTLDDIALNMSGINTTTWQERSDFLVNVFYTSIWIVMIVPFIFILARVLKKEPETQFAEEF